LGCFFKAEKQCYPQAWAQLRAAPHRQIQHMPACLRAHTTYGKNLPQKRVKKFFVCAGTAIKKLNGFFAKQPFSYLAFMV